MKKPKSRKAGRRSSINLPAGKFCAVVKEERQITDETEVEIKKAIESFIENIKI